MTAPIRPAKRETPYRLSVKRAKTGLGLFTRDPIPKGKFIIEYIGELIDDDEADRRDVRGARYLFGLGYDMNIDGATRKNLARYINHACLPNCEAYMYGRRIYIRARKRIKAGEELTYDYGPAYFDGFITKKRCVCRKCDRNRSRGPACKS